MKEKETETSIDIFELLRAILKKWWIVLLCAIIGAGAMFGYAKFFKQQTYSATIKMYVNNKASITEGIKVSLSAGDINASTAIVKTYGVILQSQLVLDEVLERSGLEDKYTYGNLLGMLSVGSIDSTPVFGVTVTSANPDDAMILANTIAAVFPPQVSEIIDGSSAKIVDYATKASPISKRVTTMSLVGLLIGAAVAAVGIVIFDVLTNDTLESAEWLETAFADKYPTLAVIPDTTLRKSGKYGYNKYGKYGKYGYRYYSSGDKSDGKTNGR